MMFSEIRDCVIDLNYAIQWNLIYRQNTLDIYYANESNSRIYLVRSSLSTLYKKYKDGNLILKDNFHLIRV